MQSTVAVTFEAVDAEAAVRDLLEQVNAALPSGPNRCGILFTEGDGEGPELVPALEQAAGMPIVGCTTIAQISPGGYHNLCATLLVLSGEDCRFGVAAALDMDVEPERKLREAFAQAAAELGDAPCEAIIVFSAGNTEFTADEKLALLDELAQGKPIFGGLASDYLDFSQTRIFYRGESHNNSLVLLLIGGNVRPKFVVRNIPRSRIAKSRITASKGTLVERIDSMTAYEAMLAQGVDPEDRARLLFAPLCVELDTEDDYDGVPICRNFMDMDKETGTGRAMAMMPVGAAVSVQMVQGKDIEETTGEALREVCRELCEQPDGYVYSTVLIVTCCARHIVLGQNRAREGEMAAAELSGATFAGFYSYGEFCPTSVHQGRAKNRLNNMSIGFCIL